MHSNPYGKIRKLLYLLTALCWTIAGCAPKNEQTVDIAPEKTLLLAAEKTVRSTLPTSTPSPSPTLPIDTPQPEEPTQSERPAEKANVPRTERYYPVEEHSFYYQPLDDELIKRITGMSYPSKNEDCAIKYDDLRYVGIEYYDFEGATHDGELIVHRKLAEEVVKIFYELYQRRYPLASVRLVDDYGEPGDDNRSMAANNTSAFNYRRVSGSKTLSRHSYGAAIDINPLYNPYIDGDRVAPPEGEAYAERDWDFPGKIDHDDFCYQIFTRYGWSWGGDWKGDKDYQHFSKDIGK